MKRVLVIAGYDPSGGAGLLMDIKMLTLLGIKTASIPTALTFQNSQVFEDWIPMNRKDFEKMLKLTFEDMPISGVKIGMLAQADLVSLTSFYLKRYRGQLEWIVYDPVLRATLEKELYRGPLFLEVVEKELFPLVDFLTPNLREAEIITGLSLKTLEDFKEAAKKLYSQGVKHILIKGERNKGRIFSYYFYEGSLKKTFSVKELPFEFHGTGCAFSSLLLGYLLKREEPLVAIKEAQRRLSFYIKKASFQAEKGRLNLIF
ncbi:MAG: hydroxymethylpyrimidine/phosphomethylpyrimidine kinase [Caldimicrobium sp.]